MQTEIGAKYARAPYWQVAHAFGDFKSPNERRRERGGIYRTGKAPILQARDTSYKGEPFSPHYHVEMSFTEEQRGYVVTVLSLMGSLALGKIPEHPSIPTPTLTQRIEDNYAERLGQARFVDALLRSDLELLQQFGDNYGNLMPAFAAIFRVAGAEGMGAATELSANYLWRVQEDHITKSEALVGDKSDWISFVIPHPTYKPAAYTPYMYEVWCSGEGFAKILMLQSAKAAINLAGRPNPTREPVFDGWRVQAEQRPSKIIRVKADELVKGAAATYLVRS